MAGTLESEDQKEVIVGAGKMNNRACVCNITLKQFECLELSRGGLLTLLAAPFPGKGLLHRWPCFV